MNLHLLISLKHSSVSVSLKHRQHDNVLARNLQLAEDAVSVQASRVQMWNLTGVCCSSFTLVLQLTIYPIVWLSTLNFESSRRAMASAELQIRQQSLLQLTYVKNTATSGSISPRLVRGYSCGRAGYCIVLSINYARRLVFKTRIKNHNPVVN